MGATLTRADRNHCIVITDRRIAYFYCGRRHCWHVPACNDARGSLAEADEALTAPVFPFIHAAEVFDV